MVKIKCGKEWVSAEVIASWGQTKCVDCVFVYSDGQGTTGMERSDCFSFLKAIQVCGRLTCHWLFKGSMPPSIGHMELLVWMQRADFSEHIQGCKSPGDPLNSSHFDAPNTKSAPTGYRRAPNIISHHYKQQLSAKASIVPKARPIRFR